LPLCNFTLSFFDTNNDGNLDTDEVLTRIYNFADGAPQVQQFLLSKRDAATAQLNAVFGALNGGNNFITIANEGAVFCNLVD